MAGGKALTRADPVWLRRYGTGPDRAVLIHCTLGHGAGWAGLMAYLGDRITALAPDQPGHGLAPPCAPGDDFHDCASARFVPLLGDDGAPRVSLVGHSYGATLALRLALARPDRVRRLVLIEPVLFAAVRGTPAWAEHAVRFAPVRDALVREDWDDALRRFLSDWGDGTGWEALAPAQRDRLMRSGGPLLRATLPAIEDDTAGLLKPGRLERLTVPVLLVRGARSPHVIAAIHDALAARLPVTARTVVPEARHMLPVTHPEALADILRPFLAG